MIYDRDYMRSRHTSWGGGDSSHSLLMPIIWVTVFIFFLQTLDQRGGMTQWLAMTSEGVRHAELWRLVTYIFAHGSIWHLLFNMWGLYVFGKAVEQAIGAPRFLYLYLTSGAIGALCWQLFNWNDQGAVVIGASGSLFGVMMAAAMLFPNQKIQLLLPPVELKLKTFVAIYAGLEVMSELSRWENGIAHLAHLGGLLGGFVYLRRAMPEAGFSPVQMLTRWWRQRRARARQQQFSAVPPPLPPEHEPMPENFREEIDRILDKIGAQGIGSLTPEERKTLEKARERLKR